LGLESLSLGSIKEDIYFKREIIERGNLLSPSNQTCNKTTETGTLPKPIKPVVIKSGAKLRQLHEYREDSSK
jgi:hypothetical protein